MSDFRIKTYVLGTISTNCYLVYNEGSREAVVVDPADSASHILTQCQALDVTPVAVMLTHGHFDHVLAVEDIRQAFQCKVYAGKDEAPLLKDPGLNMSDTLGDGKVEMKADYLVQDGEMLHLGGFDWKVISTPGHTAGSVCYYVESEGVLISGDTLFADSLGRTDLPTGNTSAIIKSITEKLFLLPDDTMVYPGHGNPTTIGYEKQYNPVTAYYRRW